MQTNTTPFVAQLPVKYGYFKAQNYRLEFELPGHAPAVVNLDSSVSGWYFGNLAFGGVIGMLIVDHGPWNQPKVRKAAMANYATTGDAARAAGATVVPTDPKLQLEPDAPGPKPVHPANPVAP